MFLMQRRKQPFGMCEMQAMKPSSWARCSRSQPSTLHCSQHAGQPRGPSRAEASSHLAQNHIGFPALPTSACGKHLATLGRFAPTAGIERPSRLLGNQRARLGLVGQRLMCRHVGKELRSDAAASAGPASVCFGHFHRNVSDAGVAPACATGWSFRQSTLPSIPFPAVPRPHVYDDLEVPCLRPSPAPSLRRTPCKQLKPL
jgi:hypothetical protein